MSLILPDNLPAIELLKQENIMVSDGMNDPKSHAPALKVGILNLMPIKETTELDLLRLLSNTHSEAMSANTHPRSTWICSILISTNLKMMISTV